MKDKAQVRPEGKAVFYAVLYNSFRQAALDCGYALALHGSLLTDMDMLAVAWTDEATSHEVLASKISNCIGHTVWKGHHLKEPSINPHGRVTYTMSIMGDWYIDLSIIPPKTN